MSREPEACPMCGMKEVHGRQCQLSAIKDQKISADDLQKKRELAKAKYSIN